MALVPRRPVAEIANNYYDIRAAVSTPAPVRRAAQQASYSLETSAS